MSKITNIKSMTCIQNKLPEKNKKDRYTHGELFAQCLNRELTKLRHKTGENNICCISMILRCSNMTGWL